jgi:hypothetical protein
MQTYRVRAYRRQLVEVFVYSDEECAYDDALDTDKHDWDVIETYEIDDFVSCEPIEDEQDDPRSWMEG